MTEKYFGGKIPDPFDKNLKFDRRFDEESRKLLEEIGSKITYLPTRFDSLSLHEALQTIWEGVGMCNRYIDVEAPWKKDKAGQKAELSAVLYNVLDFLYTVTPYLYPFMPTAAQGIFDQMGVDVQLADPKMTFESLSGIKIAGCTVKKGSPLFPRLEN
jgi:methionyl-tRNA synthetase